ncbi:hypothetical protein GCM10022217_19100 [Chryseobacterium ginsenosidimutans]|uniref:hypothetical protein n=1 Tax=Chryseobacterium ginsenosidimutans TaxID=687846 RepID=UPI0031DEB07E
MKIIKFSQEGKITFYSSFIVGTLLLLGFVFSGNSGLMVIGFYYVLIAAVINLLVFFHELIVFLSNVSDNKAHGNSAILLLLNVPVVLLYISFVFNMIPFYS